MKYSNSLYELPDIDVYRLILDGSLRAFPHGFWDGVPGYKTAINILRYLFNNILKCSIEDIKDKVSREIFEEYKLAGMISYVFDDSIYIAIGEAYPELKEWADELYKSNPDYRRYTDEDLIQAIQNKATELNRNPKSGEMRKPGGFIIAQRFGSWDKALMKAELIEDIYKDINFEEFLKEDVIQNLKKICISKERLLEKEEIYQLYPEGLIKEYFGSYSNLTKVLENDYTKEELIDILKNKAEKLGRTPSNKDMKFPRAIVFIDKFGNWQNATKIL